MKRTFIIRNIIIAIIIIGIVAGIAYYFTSKINRDYELEKVEEYNYFILKQQGKYGVINKSGETVVDVKYDEVKIPNPSKAVFICYDGENIKVLKEKGKEIFTEYKNVEPIRLKNIASNLMYEKSVLKYKENEKYGLINFEGKKITKAIYDEIEGLPYKEGELIVKNDGKLGVINIKGKKMVDIKYDNVEVDAYYTEGSSYRYAGYIVSNKTNEGYRYGYINYNGKVILKDEYNQVSRIIDIENKDDIYLIVAKDGQYGVISKDKEIIKNEYQSIEYDKTNNVLTIEKNKKYGIATLDGNVIIPTKYDQIDVTGVYIYAQNNQGTTVYNSNGTEANIDKNTEILETENEKYKIRIKNENGTQYGVIGKDGKQIIEEKYKYIGYLYDDYFIVSDEKSKLGVIDNKEKEKIAIENDSIQKIEGSNVLKATITNGNLTRIYSPNMEKLCEMENAIIKVEGSYIKVYNDDETRYFSKEGKELSSKEVYTQNTLLAKKENDKWGFADRSGQIVVKAEYDEVTEYNKYGYAGVKKDGKWGVLNSQGKEVLAPTYEFNNDVEPNFINKYYQVTFGYGEEYYTEDK